MDVEVVAQLLVDLFQLLDALRLLLELKAALLELVRLVLDALACAEVREGLRHDLVLAVHRLLQFVDRLLVNRILLLQVRNNKVRVLEYFVLAGELLVHLLIGCLLLPEHRVHLVVVSGLEAQERHDLQYELALLLAVFHDQRGDRRWALDRRLIVQALV